MALVDGLAEIGGRAPRGWVDARARADARGRRAAPTAPPRSSRRSSRSSSSTGTLDVPRRPGRQRARAPTRSGAALARLDAERHRRAARRRRRTEAAARRCRRHRRAPTLCPSRGTPRSRRSPPTGATCSARSSSTRPTTSSQAALHLAPINPRRVGAHPAGSSSGARAASATAPRPGMVRRCLERCDADGHPRPRRGRSACSRTRTRSARRARSGRSTGGWSSCAQLGAEALGERRRRSRRAGASRPPRRACARPTGRRPRTRPTCGPRRPARRGRRRRRGSRAAPRPAASRAAATRSPAGDLLGHGDGDVLADRRVGDHVAVGDRLARARRRARRGRARTRPTRPRAARGWSSPRTPAGGARGLARMEQRVLAALEATARP